MILLESGEDEQDHLVWYVYSNDGDTANTSVATGGYNGKSAKLLQEHATLDKAGPLFVPYDPAWSALLAMNF